MISSTAISAPALIFIFALIIFLLIANTFMLLAIIAQLDHMRKRLP